jgi:hypothetical protein
MNTKLHKLQKTYFCSMSIKLHELKKTHFHSINTKLSTSLHTLEKGSPSTIFICQLTMIIWHLGIMEEEKSMSGVTVIMNNTDKCFTACVPGSKYCLCMCRLQWQCGNENELLQITIPTALGHSYNSMSCHSRILMYLHNILLLNK